RDCVSREPAKQNRSTHGKVAKKYVRAAAPASTCPTPWTRRTEYGAHKPATADLDCAERRQALVGPSRSMFHRLPYETVPSILWRISGQLSAPPGSATPIKLRLTKTAPGHILSNVHRRQQFSCIKSRHAAAGFAARVRAVGVYVAHAIRQERVPAPPQPLYAGRRHPGSLRGVRVACCRRLRTLYRDWTTQTPI